jgi:hypothetical protein
MGGKLSASGRCSTVNFLPVINLRDGSVLVFTGQMTALIQDCHQSQFRRHP